MPEPTWDVMEDGRAAAPTIPDNFNWPGLIDLLLKGIGMAGQGTDLGAAALGTRVTGGALSAPGFLLSVTAPLVALFAGIYGIGQANLHGAALGRYNAWLVSFAHTVVGASRHRDVRRYNPVYMDASIQGRNTAIRLMSNMRPPQRRAFLVRFGGMTESDAFRFIVEELGGLRTR